MSRISSGSRFSRPIPARKPAELSYARGFWYAVIGIAFLYAAAWFGIPVLGTLSDTLRGWVGLS